MTGVKEGFGFKKKTVNYGGGMKLVYSLSFIYRTVSG